MRAERGRNDMKILLVLTNNSEQWFYVVSKEDCTKVSFVVVEEIVSYGFGDL
jgi:hypothetical protein